MNIFYIIQFFIYIVSAFLMWRDEDQYAWVLLAEIVFLIIYMINMFKKNKGRYIPIKELGKFILINILSIVSIVFFINTNILIDYNEGWFAGIAAVVFIFVFYPFANGITLIIFCAVNLGKYINKKIKAKKETEKLI